MKIYIGAKFKNADIVNRLTGDFRKKGIFNNYNWAYDVKTDETLADLVDSGNLEKEAVKDADALVFLLPLGRGGNMDFGMGISEEKPIILCAENEKEIMEDPVNYYMMPNVTTIISDYAEIDDKIFDKLNELKPKTLGEKTRN